ncbi:MAG: LamG-like jellyroll fold domain-containing protein, partial [Verrucomicrobiota bacterium]
MKRTSTILRFGSAVLLTLFAALTAQADYQSTVLSQNPAGYYRLSETVQPQVAIATNTGSLGASANGSYISLPALNLPGPFAGSVSVGLDGTAQYVSTPWVAGLNPDIFSVEIWANPSQVPKFAYLASSVHIASPRSGWYLAQDDGSTFGFGSAWVVRMFNTNASTQTITLHATNSTPGVWTHLVLTYDGTTATLYTNGVVADSGNPTKNSAGLGYVGNVDSVFTVGCRSSLNFFWPGQVAETALYGGSLSASRVSSHYAAGINTPASYSSTVLADSPVLYHRYQAPAQAPTANQGTLGSAGNGLFLADAKAGVAGPTSPVYPGFEAANKGAAFTGSGGAVRLPPFNFNTNTVTISGWVNASNAQAVGAGIVVSDAGTTYAGLTIDAVDGALGLGYVWNNDANSYNWRPTADAGLAQLPDSNWAYVALVVDPTKAVIYLAISNNPASFTSVTNFLVHVNQSFDGPTLIGTDAGTYSFNGAIDEVAIWNRSLGSGELYSQYASAVGGIGPIVFSGPTNPDQPIVAGDTLTLSVDAGGTPNLSYQWRSNGVPIPSATSRVYTKSNFSIAADSSSYDVIVANSFGSATSGVAVVTGQLATAPVIISGPISRTLYPGGLLNLNVVATGGGLTYQWKRSNTNLPGATASSYVVSSATTNDAGSYTVSVTNSLGGTNLGPAVITVPVLVSNTYAAVIDAEAPDAWWRLDDTSVSTGSVLFDALGRHDGTYTNLGGLTAGNPGAITGGIAGTAATFSGDGSYGSVPFFASLSNPKLTLELWGKQSTVANNATAASSFDQNGNGFGIGTGSYWIGVNGGGNFGSAPGGASAGNESYDSTIRPNQWVHLVIIYGNSGNPTFPYQIYINGKSDGFIWGNSGTGLNGIKPFIIGGKGTGLASILDHYFIGSVDEVAFYGKALTATQIQAHYAAAFFGVPPSFTSQPLSQNAFAGENVTFSATAVGAPTITLQWKKNGVNIAGQTNSSLTVSNVYYGSADTYTVTATNPFGSLTSSGATITVNYPPVFANLTNGLVLHLTFDTDYSDSSGHANNGTVVGAPTLVAGKIGSKALSVSTDTTNSIYNYVSLGSPSDLLFGSNVNFS